MMIGAIIGDVIGSAYEWNNVRSKDFPLFSHTTEFTDDTVMTIAVADKILHNKNYVEVFKQYGRDYPNAGYGGHFDYWLKSSNTEPYNSYGNGSAMRVSPVGFAFNTLEEVLAEAKLSAEVTHNHPEGIKGAQAVAASIFLARAGSSKGEIKDYVEREFHYDLDRTIDEIRPVYRFNETCQGSVPEAIIAFLESEDFEDAIRTAISIGGDSDTIACITGGIAEGYYKSIPLEIITKTISYLPEEFISIINLFRSKTGAALWNSQT